VSAEGERLLAGACPAPRSPGGVVRMGHGSGGRLGRQLLDDHVFPAFEGPELARGEDQALLPRPGGRLAFTADGFVVTPLEFPGGDLGSLAVHGTVNDLAVGGARPRWLSLGLILEEGLELALLDRLLASAAAAARACGVRVVTGDTKVVGRGQADGVYMTTSGVGEVPDGLELGAAQLRPGDRVLVSGGLAEHGLAVLGAREDLGLPPELVSDSAPLHELVGELLASGARVRCMRDPTRGGVAASLHEWAAQAGVGIELEEGAIPLAPAVHGACELLGLDPLHVANEGKLLVGVAAEDAGRALAALRGHALGSGAVELAEVVEGRGVVVRTTLGGRRSLDLPLTDPLPRIC